MLIFKICGYVGFFFSFVFTKRKRKNKFGSITVELLSGFTMDIHCVSGNLRGCVSQSLVWLLKIRTTLLKSVYLCRPWDGLVTGVNFIVSSLGLFYILTCKTRSFVR